MVALLKRATTKAAREYEAWHPIWVADEVTRIASRHAARTKRNPGSQRSILASMTKRQQRTWQSYRKLRRRPSRGTGKRQRSPSEVALAASAWENANPIQAAILQELVVQGRPLAEVALGRGVSNGAVLERLRMALDSLQDAIDAAKALKGPQNLPR